ncbi:MAG: HEAT repeat domain-containing protein [Candidatus Eremiobacteraeota bacterium]|nr:HEAT repeat domain-containing protein [Candidatus Eremiobacteraeota bacterium]
MPGISPLDKVKELLGILHDKSSSYGNKESAWLELKALGKSPFVGAYREIVAMDYDNAIRELEEIEVLFETEEVKGFFNNSGIYQKDYRIALGYLYCAFAAVEAKAMPAVRDYQSSNLLENARNAIINLETEIEGKEKEETGFTDSDIQWGSPSHPVGQAFDILRNREMKSPEAREFTFFLLGKKLPLHKKLPSDLFGGNEEEMKAQIEKAMKNPFNTEPVLLRFRRIKVYAARRIPINNRVDGWSGTLIVKMISPGRGNFYSYQNNMVLFSMDNEFRKAINTAWEYAKDFLEDKNVDVFWRLETSDSLSLNDKSIGAPMALALRQLVKNEPIDPSCAITGSIVFDTEDGLGKVGEVGRIRAKVEKAIEDKISIFMLSNQEKEEEIKSAGEAGAVIKPITSDVVEEAERVAERDDTTRVVRVETIDEAAEYASGLPKEVKRYLEFVGQESEELNILKRLGKQINLKDIYISVKTTKWEKRDYQEERRREMERIKGKWEEEKDLIFKDPRIPRGGDREKKGEEKAKVFQWKDERKKYRKCAFLGDPGAGKSTLLRWESCHVVEDGLKTIEKGERYSDIEIPMFIRLAEISSSLMENRKDGNVPDLLNVHINSKLKPVFQDDGFSKFIKNQAKEGKVCFLLDALDEVPDGERKVLDESLKNLEICYKKCRFLLTSRIVGYSGCPFNLAGKIEDYTLTLVPFGWKETERFVKSWFHGSALAKKGKNFLNELKKNREMKGLSQNPLLLTLLCALYEEESGDGKGDGKIPVKKSQLYDKCINNFLTIWKSTKDKAETDHKLKLDAKRILYADMAFHFFSQGKEFFPEQETLNFIKFHDRVKEFAGSPTFDEESITDWKRFLISLKDSDNKHTVFVYSKLSKEERNLIDEWNADCKIDEDLITDITIGLNRILLDKRFYKNELFRDLEIFQEAQSTSEKKGANLRSKEIQLLNRNTIESIFPNLIQNLYIDEILSDGILVPAGYDKSGVAKFMFLHRTFQEYLTACALSEDPLSEPVERPSITAKKNKPTVKLTGIDFIESQLWDFEWWEEVILLMSSRFGDESGKTDGYNNGVGGHNKAEDLVKMLLEHDDQRCIEEAFTNPIEDREPLRQMLFLAVHCCGDGNVTGDSVDSVIKLLNSLRNRKKEYYALYWEVINALGKIGPNALPALKEMLKDDDWPVRIVVEEALGNIGSTEAIPALKEALKNDGWWVHKGAAEALVEIGSEAIPALKEALKDRDRSIGMRAARALGEIGSTEAIPALKEALKDDKDDESWRVRETAAGALGKIGSTEAIPALIEALKIEALKDEDLTVIAAAARALGKIGSVDAITAIMEAFKGRDWYVRRVAVEAWGKIGSTEAIPALKEALKDENKHVRNAAVEALGNIGSEAIPALIEALKHDDWWVRKRAAEALGKIGSNEAIPMLKEALKDENKYVRNAAVRAWGKIGSNEAMPEIKEALKDDKDDESWRVRETAAGALGKIGSTEAIPAIGKALKDENKWVRKAAVEALGNIGSTEAIPALIEALKDDDWWVRKTAAEALGKIGSNEAIPMLKEALKDENKYVRNAAVEAWGKDDESYRVRNAAAKALGEIGSTEAIPALKEALKDDCWSVFRTAVVALGEIGSMNILPLDVILTMIDRMIYDPYNDVKIACYNALLNATRTLRREKKKLNPLEKNPLSVLLKNIMSKFSSWFKIKPK